MPVYESQSEELGLTLLSYSGMVLTLDWLTLTVSRHELLQLSQSHIPFYPPWVSDHAIVFSASGTLRLGYHQLTLLDGYPTLELFSKVSALTNRPLSPEIAQWPPSHGVDLLQHGGQHALENELQMKVTDIESVTHVYFSALIKIADLDEDIELNVQILVRAVGAIEHLSKNLKFLVLPTGTMYGTPTSRDRTVETAHLVPLRPTAYF
ncbi:hypothetical protein B0H14DRAFT_3593443 [Mycena olivaceomarginata]|nr:hypothetical protein B0H14DRAFT_3593443 [Mycena olivaceomarginata]